MSIENIQKRAKYLAIIREYFKRLDVLEVDTPIAYNYGVTDIFIDLFEINTISGRRYLQSSPEYAMKRLIAEGSGSIYQICKAFRDESCGKYHNHEFTLIEWYRLGINYFDLMKEIELLFLFIKPDSQFIYLSYQDAFEKYYNFNPHTISLDNLQKIVEENIGNIHGLKYPTKADYIDILFSYKIEKDLNQKNTVYFIYNYTIFQSGLARKITDKNNQKVSARFEVFYNGIEIANGYYELLDKKEQLYRFENDLAIRKYQNKAVLDIDTKLLDCLEKIPECSGVALGLERLLMSLEGIKNIKKLSIF